MNKQIKLKKGFQKKIILAAKNKNKISWEKLGELVGVSGSYLSRDLKYEKNLISKKLYLQLCRLANINYNSMILKELDYTWGRSKGGQNSKSKAKEPKLLTTKYSKELAEIIGIMLGDGNSWSGRKGFYYIRVAGHSENDRNYLLNYVKPLFQKVFGITMQILEHNTRKEMFLHKGSKDLVYTLDYFGFPTGNKMKNKVRIPDWIFKSNIYLKACIRGLVDTDGSVCPITGRDYPYIWFRSYIPELRDSFARGMDQLDIKIAKWSSKSRSQTFIGAKPMIRKYFKVIGFANSYHRKRYEIYAPVV